MRFTRFLPRFLLGVVLVLGPALLPSPAGSWVSTGAVGLLILVLAATWRADPDSGRAWWTMGLFVVFGGGMLALAALLPVRQVLPWWPVAVGLGVLAGFVVQLLRGVDAHGRTQQLAYAVAGIGAVTSGAGWVLWTRMVAGELAEPRAWVPAAVALLLGGLLAGLALRRREERAAHARTGEPVGFDEGATADGPVDVQAQVRVASAEAALVAVLAMGVPVALAGRLLGL